MKLHTYFRSSAAFRVRIALNLKGLAYDTGFVHLAKGEHRTPAYGAVNPQALARLLENGVKLRPFSKEIMEACFKATQEGGNAESNAPAPCRATRNHDIQWLRGLRISRSANASC